MPGIMTLMLAAAVVHHPAGAPVAGRYQVHQMEMGGALELRKDGHFRYAFTYGAIDEEGRGNWKLDGKTVRLTSDPMPKRASFELVRDDPAPKGELYMTLEDPGFEWGHSLDALVSADMKSAKEVSADETGRVDLTDAPVVAAIAPMMPVYGPTGDIFHVTTNQGHKLLFRFHKNDLGQAIFEREPLAREGSDLLLLRYDTKVRFIRTRP